jgi:hypothetical protein
MRSKRKNSEEYVLEEEPNDDDRPNTPKRTRLSKTTKLNLQDLNRKKLPGVEAKTSSKEKKQKQAEVAKETESYEVEDLTSSDIEDVVKEIEIAGSPAKLKMEVQEPIEIVGISTKKGPKALPKNNIGAEITTLPTLNDIASIPIDGGTPQPPNSSVPSGKVKKHKAVRKNYDEEKMVAVPRMAPMPPIGEFPRFVPRGNRVYIELVAGSDRYTYRFDMEKLKQMSKWWFDNLSKEADKEHNKKEPDLAIARQWTSDYGPTGPTHVFDLEYRRRRELWFLRRTVS